jgi:hypothetical protein
VTDRLEEAREIYLEARAACASNHGGGDRYVGTPTAGDFLRVVDALAIALDAADLARASLLEVASTRLEDDLDRLRRELEETVGGRSPVDPPAGLFGEGAVAADELDRVLERRRLIESLRRCSTCGHTRDRHPDADACGVKHDSGELGGPCQCRGYVPGELSPAGFPAR